MVSIFISISFLASIVGAICGIGGGIIIKPVLDAFGNMNVSEINFLSGCTVLSMSIYSVLKLRSNKESKIDISISLWLAIGSVTGGILGKQNFEYIKGLFDNGNMIGAVQAALLFIITLGALVYTIRKDKIRSLSVKNPFACIILGAALGVMSSFLGIGGGPINLIVLYYFFSMDTKTASQNSLYIILFSQASSMLSVILSKSIPDIPLMILGGMVISGILGGIFGRKINKRINGKAVDKLFIGLMCVILTICCYNFYKYTYIG